MAQQYRPILCDHAEDVADSNANDMNLGDFIAIGDHQHPLERAALRRRQGREDLVANRLEQITEDGKWKTAALPPPAPP